MRARGLSLSFISGAWSQGFVDLALPKSSETSLCAAGTAEIGGKWIISKVLILASETIYSPSYLLSFAETLTALMRRATSVDPGGDSINNDGDGNGMAASRALIAAKKIYFGVGGGVQEFLEVLRSVPGGERLKIDEHVDIEGDGVERVILDVQI